MNSRRFLAGAGVLAIGFLLHAESVKDREGAVRSDRAKMENSERWIYNDIDRGFDEARKTGKPLLVVLRCVPCLACMGIDAQVLLEDQELSKLLDQFVRVRIINANALDLSRFQFDYDLSFTTMFFNGDGTVYGRYGSWTHQKNSQETATVGFRRAMEAALSIHGGYPGNKGALAGKQGVPIPFKTPVEIPMLAEKYTPQLDWEGKVVQSCVHCHMVGAAIQAWHREQRKPMPDEWTYPWPEPETIGLSLASDDVARVTAVTSGSPAGQAGIQAGDELAALDGAPLVSIADVSWALHRAPESGALTATVRRAGQEMALKISLPPQWRHASNVGLRGTVWRERGMATGGLSLEEINAEDRAARGLAAGSLALRVKAVGQYGMHAAAKKAGFQKDDILVEIDGVSRDMNESRLLGYLLQNRMMGDQVKAVVLRGTERKELTLPMQ